MYGLTLKSKMRYFVSLHKIYICIDTYNQLHAIIVLDHNLHICHGSAVFTNYSCVEFVFTIVINWIKLN